MILERERKWDGGGKRERERKREKHRSVVSLKCPDLGSNPQLRYVP